MNRALRTRGKISRGLILVSMEAQDDKRKIVEHKIHVKKRIVISFSNLVIEIRLLKKEV